MYKYTKIQGPRFQRNYIIARYRKSDLHGTSSQSSPKINRIDYHKTHFHTVKVFQHPIIAILLIKILFFPTTQSTLSSDKIRGKALYLIFPKLSLQNMRGFNHATILSPSLSSQGTPGTMAFFLWPQKRTKKFLGVLPEKLDGVCSTLPETLTLFQTKICDFPCHISDLIKNLIPFFRLEALEPGAWPERMTSCCGTYSVVGVNIKRELVLSPNDEKVANSSKKTYPIQD